MGQTRIDLQHLPEDLRDAYSGSLEETILAEVIANALESGATRIRFQSNATTDATLTIVDDGHRCSVESCPGITMLRPARSGAAKALDSPASGSSLGSSRLAKS